MPQNGQNIRKNVLNILAIRSASSLEPHDDLAISCQPQIGFDYGPPLISEFVIRL